MGLLSKKKLVKKSFVTINVKVQKYMCIRMMKTHYNTSKSVSFEVHQSIKASYEAMSEQTMTAQILYIYIYLKSVYAAN